jgi:hypothetical protein
VDIHSSICAHIHKLFDMFIWTFGIVDIHNWTAWISIIRIVDVDIPQFRLNVNPARHLSEHRSHADGSWLRFRVHFFVIKPINACSSSAWGLINWKASIHWTWRRRLELTIWTRDWTTHAVLPMQGFIWVVYMLWERQPLSIPKSIVSGKTAWIELVIRTHEIINRLN